MGSARRVFRRASAPGSEAVRRDVNGGRSYSHSRVAKTRLLWELVEKIRPERDPARNYPSRQILGIRFFDGEVDEAVAVMSAHGGFLVAPSGTCFARLVRRDGADRKGVIFRLCADSDVSRSAC